MIPAKDSIPGVKSHLAAQADWIITPNRKAAHALKDIWSSSSGLSPLCFHRNDTGKSLLAEPKKKKTKNEKPVERILHSLKGRCLRPLTKSCMSINDEKVSCQFEVIATMIQLFAYYFVTVRVWLDLTSQTAGSRNLFAYIW